MRDTLLQHQDGQPLSRQQANAAFTTMMTGGASEAEIAEFLKVIARRGATVDEIIGAASVMREHSTKIDTSHVAGPILDTCGTGGDVKGTFNISTAAAIVAAAAGAAVVKHGNRSASGRSGSADVLEALGVRIDADGACLKRSLQQANICFAFARSHHPAMRHVAAVRTSLGIPTIFNLLGPLTNPGNAKRQLIGVFAPHLTDTLANVLKELGSERAWVVHGTDGLDELSTMAPTQISELHHGEVRSWTLDARELGLPIATLGALRANTSAESATIIQRVLAGEAGAARDIVILNAAAALLIAGVVHNLTAGLERARSTVDSGNARKTLDALVQSTQK